MHTTETQLSCWHLMDFTFFFYYYKYIAIVVETSDEKKNGVFPVLDRRLCRPVV